MKHLARISLITLLVGVTAFSNIFLLISNAHAADARNFNAGRIIDDGVFANSGSMSVQEIQNFFNSKVTCDTWGQKPSELGGGTRAQWMNARGIYAPFRCMTDYKENPANGQNNYGKNETPAGAISAAQIIYNYSQQFTINPQVIIATLQKENGMITDEWPTPKQFSEAMGFGCPDNVAPGAPACNPSYGSFSAQIYQAARHFRGYVNNSPGWFVPFTTGNNSIRWSPNSACGSGTVYIENRATVALYSYTPYQPNQAAKNAQYGTGDGCSAYGNRNFYLFFTDWFGSTYGSVNITTPLTVTNGFSQGLFTNRTITARFTIKNNTSQRQDLGTMAIAGRDVNYNNLDFGPQHIVLDPWQTYTYQATTTLSNEGKYSFSIANYREGVGWSTTFPGSSNVSHAREINDAIVQNMPTVTTGPVFDSTDLHVGQSTNVRMTIKNNSTLYPVNLGYFGLAMTSPSGKNADVPFDTVTSLAAGASYSYVKTFTPTEKGTYKARVSSTGDGGQTWSEALYPAAAATADNRVNVSVKNNPTITQGMKITQNGQYAGDTVTGTFSVKNFGSTTVTINKKLCYIVRGPNGSNNDLGCLDITTIAAGQELTFTGTRAITAPGQYIGYFSMYDGSWRDNVSFDKELGTEATGVSFIVKDNPTITQGLTLSTATPRVGDTITGSFKVKNNSSQAVDVNKKLCYIMRGPNGTNYDLGCLSITTIAAGQTLTFSGDRKVNDAGQYNGYFSMYDGSWHDNWTPSLATGAEPKTIQFTSRNTPTLTQGLTISNPSPSVGSTVTGQFKVKNNSSSDVTINKKLCYIVRGPNGSNNDLGCLDITTIAAGQELTFTGTRAITAPGQYIGYFSMYDGSWRDNVSFDKEIGTEPTSISFTAH